MNRCAALAAIAISLLAGGSLGANEPDSLRQALGTLPPFKLTDQEGNIVGRDQLAGQICVFSVFFSCCIDSCPVTQATMARLQEKFAAYPGVVLISVNVFPGHDTPEILAEYARRHNADPKRWLFLHGDKGEIYNLVQQGLKQALEQNSSASPGREVNHTPNFLVVDWRGVVRGYVNGTNADEVQRLEAFVKELVLARFLPRLNAGLNGVCAGLLVAGFILIRRRLVAAHKWVMMGALTVSALFLVSYIYYHFAVLKGEPTRFEGEGLMRVVYFSILLSHTVLATAVAPMALRVAYLGWQGRLKGHSKLARWTLPMWLYVSVTGVAVYFMLYQVYPPT